MLSLKLCGVCHKKPGTDRHHCLYRRDVRFKKWLDVEENLEWVCHSCHMQGLADTYEHRKEFWRRQIKRYGRKRMERWRDSLPFKTETENWDG